MSELKIQRVAILGASGYTGADVVRLAVCHPYMTVVALAGERKAGSAIDAVLPHFIGQKLPDLVATSAINWQAVDVVFGCLPHATSQSVVAEIFAANPAIRIIDLSADFRLEDADVYTQWYATARLVPDLQSQACYGLTEHNRARIADAKLVACPGCYPTAALLALLPPLVRGTILSHHISIMALSGVSGAGRALKEQNLFCEVAEAMHPYALGGHRHMPEIEQELAKVAGAPVQISFVPHLVPINRGELETITVELAPGKTVADVRAALVEAYADEPFVHVLAEGVAPATRMVRGSNHCVMNVFADRIAGRAIIVSAIDNLVKGSAGQAIQNFNVMIGAPETTGLGQLALFP